MRQNLVKKGDEFLRYEIREIVEVAKKIESLGQSITWENIGDPIAKGEKIPQWMKALVAEAVGDDSSYAYAPTKGDLDARKFVLAHYGDPRKCSVEDIIFFNGLGEAINKIFSNLPSAVRVIGPNPTYPSHATAEAMHHGGHHLTYSLRLNEGGRIDLDELENKVKYNESISGILVINPNNPTGVVFSRADLEKVVEIARTYDCFLIFDEIYQNIVFDETKITRLSDIIGDVAGISMKGISKEIPWPGARCGWIEVYNAEKHPNFQAYIHTIVVSKMLEVCSTTLPQRVFPKIVAHAEYPAFFAQRKAKYAQRLKIALEILSRSNHLLPVVPDGVFYLTVRINPDSLHAWSPLESKNKEIRLFIDSLVSASTLTLDKRFVYELLGSEGVCVVPLSGFNCPINGFRMTLLEENDTVFIQTCEKIVRAADMFFSS